MRADGVALEFRGEVAVGALVHEDVEVIEPEIRQHFVELAIAIDRAQDFALLQIARHHLRRPSGQFDAAAQIGRSRGEERLAQLLRQRADHLVLLIARHGHERRQPVLRGSGAQGANFLGGKQSRQCLRVGGIGRRRAIALLLAFASGESHTQRGCQGKSQCNFQIRPEE